MKKEKKERRSGPLFLIIIIILLLIIAFSLFNIARLIGKYQVGTVAYDKVAAQVVPEEDARENLNWKKLRKINKDTVAWLRNPGTVINYPVAQGEDNEFYLHHLITGEYDFKGSLFMEAANDRNFRDFNTIIYGHRMKDGSMFHSLSEYLDREYYEKHKVMQLYTPQRVYELHVFAAMEVPVDSPLYRIDFQSEAEKQEYLNMVDAESVLDTDIEPAASDRIVMLSTCAYDYENARDLVFGVLREK